ncbi:MAG: hypothetical protein ACTTHI_06700 [Prevotella sp.]
MKRKNLLFANIQYSIGYVYRWIVRATKCQGFGIQSPWAFRFARNVINEHSPYYAYSELKKAFPCSTKLDHKLGKLYFRVANFIQPTCWCFVGEMEECIEQYVRSGCKTTKIISVNTDKELFCSGIANEERTVLFIQNSKFANDVLQNAISQLSKNSVVVMPYIYKNRVNEKLWQFIVNKTKVQECFDLYYCGMAFLDEKRYPHYYKINF